MRVLSTVRLAIIAVFILVSLPTIKEPDVDIYSYALDSASMPQARLSNVDARYLDNRLTGNASTPDIEQPYSGETLSLTQAFTNDRYVNEQWALPQIEASKLWRITTGEPNIVVAILDTGIDQNHEDLSSKVVAEINFTDSPATRDIYGHGTPIAGIIAATSNNGIGIAGLAPQSHLMNVKVANDNGRVQAAILSKGIVWASDNGASVINVSLELKEPSSELEAAVNYAWSKGALVIVAAGNDGSNLSTFPANYKNCIAVAATSQNNALAPLSNCGDWVDVAAPGFNIYSTLPNNKYGYKSGTSFATAYVSGLAALLFTIVTDKSGNGRLNDEVRAAIESGCQENSICGVGRGLINASNSLAVISNVTS